MHNQLIEQNEEANPDMAKLWPMMQPLGFLIQPAKHLYSMAKRKRKVKDVNPSVPHITTNRPVLNFLCKFRVYSYLT